ncbi:MAG: AbrB/MazE/SpoVT family DNA-binding domain-containing protein [Rubrivivax sp.]|nr:AbrB/MazE/SpoVT family DNA-binding domain-containing protein [Rubrivivax sp.]
MAETATLTSKSQLTLPKAVRDALGVGPGDQIRFVPSLNGFRIVANNGDITRLRGVFKGRVSKAVSIEEMDRSIAEAVAARDKRSRAR